MLVKVLTIIAVLVSCFSSQHEPTGDVTCDSPSVERGDPGHVTCNFNVDVSTQKRPISVKVVLYKIDNSDVDVLECNLLQSSPVICTLKEGYQFDEQIGEQLQVSITAASDEHVGRYVCSLMSNEMLPESQPCEFRLEGSTWPTPAVTTRAEEEKDKGSTWPTPAEEEKDKEIAGSEQEEDAEKPWVIPVVVTSVVIIIGVVIVVVLVRRYRCQGQNSDTRPQTKEGDEETQLDQEHRQSDGHVMSIVNEIESRQKADVSPRPVIWSSAGAREEGEDDERSPLVNRDAAGPEDNTGTKREYNTDQQEAITRSAAQPTAIATGSDDNNTDHVVHPPTQVTSAPVETEPDNRQKADVSPRPVSRTSAGAREEGEDDERSPLVNRDAASPEDNTGTKREYNTDQQEAITGSAAQPTAMATGSDDNNTDHVDHPPTQVTSAPVETEPDDSNSNGISDTAEVTEAPAGNDDNSAEQGGQPPSHVTSIPVGPQPEDSDFSIQRESYEDTTPEPTKDEAEGGQSDDEDKLSVGRRTHPYMGTVKKLAKTFERN